MRKNEWPETAMFCTVEDIKKPKSGMSKKDFDRYTMDKQKADDFEH